MFLYRITIYLCSCILWNVLTLKLFFILDPHTDHRPLYGRVAHPGADGGGSGRPHPAARGQEIQPLHTRGQEICEPLSIDCGVARNIYSVLGQSRG